LFSVVVATVTLLQLDYSIEGESPVVSSFQV